MKHLPSVLLVLTAAATAATAPRPAQAQGLDPSRYASLRYRFIGPEGNRAIAVVGEPGNPLSIYVGAASGGLWRTRDGGVNWTPVFDDQSASSVSALAMAPSDPNGDMGRYGGDVRHPPGPRHGRRDLPLDRWRRHVGKEGT